MINPKKQRADAATRGLNGKRAKQDRPRNKKHQTKNEENPVMRADEVWRILRVGKNTLYTWVAEGKIPCKKVGRVILFSRKRFYEWLENNENKGGAK